MEAFGESSDSESDAPAGGDCGKRWRWEAVAGVRGLWLCTEFLSADEQAHLLGAIQRGGPTPRFAALSCASRFLLRFSFLSLSFFQKTACKISIFRCNR
jgi:hypothetical protein